jgi:hypothetical protein
MKALAWIVLIVIWVAFAALLIRIIAAEWRDHRSPKS